MRKLLNVLYVSAEDSYLFLDGETVVIRNDEGEIGRVPLLNLEEIVSFGYRGASPALMGACAERNISLSFMTPQGRFLARIIGKTKGNVLLRIKQHQVAASEASLDIAKNCILGKIYNGRWVLERATRDHAMQVDTASLKKASTILKETMARVVLAENKDQLRGEEGEAARIYFGVFDELILQQKNDFYFLGRSRRPPLDKVNALLSFCYSLLTSSVASALETVGLDPYVGMMHADRPGRASLALDLMEELRPAIADRFVLYLINKRIVNGKNFIQKENGAVLLKDDARKIILAEWQNRKKEQIEHPFLKEKIEWGLVPFAQAMLLSRHLRGDLDEYPPFLWK